MTTKMKQHLSQISRKRKRSLLFDIKEMESRKPKNFQALLEEALHKKLSFPLRIYLVNVTKSAISSGFGHIYWRNP